MRGMSENRGELRRPLPRLARGPDEDEIVNVEGIHLNHFEPLHLVLIYLSQHAHNILSHLWDGGGYVSGTGCCV